MVTIDQMVKSDKDTFLWALLVFVIVFFVVAILGTLFYAGAIFDDTKYAPGYNEGAFQSIKTGLTKTQVQLMLGRPLKAHVDTPHDYEAWLYTSSGRFHWRQKAVCFKKGKVYCKIDNLDGPE